MALQTTTIYQSSDRFVAHFNFTADADVTGNIAHGIPGLSATALAATAGDRISVALFPVVGIAGVATTFYLGEYFVASVDATNIVVGKRNIALSAAATRIARVELVRIRHPS